jgi:hypothetical protein
MKFCLILRVIWCQLAFALSLVSGLAHVTNAQTIEVDIRPGHSTNSFRPSEALGAGVDRIPLAATDKIFTEPVQADLVTGWKPSATGRTICYTWKPGTEPGRWSSPGGVVFRWRRNAHGIHSSFV